MMTLTLRKVEEEVKCPNCETGQLYKLKSILRCGQCGFWKRIFQ